jgi:subtilisin family serine protease
VKRTAISLACVAAALGVNTLSAAAATSYPNDYFFVEGDQWALTGSAASINAPAAWCASTGSGILVADVDTGANFNHEDLAGKLQAGAAFLGGTAPDKDHPTGTGQAAVQDDNGHGSMTTGIMVADTGNGRGIAAVAPDARALIVKVLDANGSGYESDVADGIEWAVDHGANVVNLSIGPGSIAGTGIAPPGTPATSLIPGAIKYAAQHGVAVAVAAGNSGISAADYISLSQGMQAVTVGALGPADTVASYSNYGYGVSVYAPGGDAPSANAASLQNMVVSAGTPGRQDYVYSEGTSFAAPHVAGALALLMSTGKSASQAMSAVVNTAATSSDGFPQLDAAAALGRSKGALCGSPSTTGTVAPPGGVSGPGGQHQSVPPPAAMHPTFTAAPKATGTPPPAPTATPAQATPSPTGAVGAIQQGAEPPQQGGRAAPPALSSGSGGAPSPLLLGGLAGLIVVGAPLGTWAVRILRRPPGPG